MSQIHYSGLAVPPPHLYAELRWQASSISNEKSVLHTTQIYIDSAHCQGLCALHNQPNPLLGQWFIILSKFDSICCFNNFDSTWDCRCLITSEKKKFDYSKVHNNNTKETIISIFQAVQLRIMKALYEENCFPSVSNYE